MKLTREQIEELTRKWILSYAEKHKDDSFDEYEEYLKS